jgi:hypothetical protein
VPSADERRRAQAYLDEQSHHFAQRDRTSGTNRPASPFAPSDPSCMPDELALATLCQVLMNTNEFIYVD